MVDHPFTGEYGLRQVAKEIGYNVTEIVALSERNPKVSPEELLAGFHPSYRFGEVSFDTYIPDPAHPSQVGAVERLRDFAATIGVRKSSGGLLSLFSRKAGKCKSIQINAVYLDCCFGVCRTLLLASLWLVSSGK